jgi:hypothetical protein
MIGHRNNSEASVSQAFFPENDGDYAVMHLHSCVNDEVAL